MQNIWTLIYFNSFDFRVIILGNYDSKEKAENAMKKFLIDSFLGIKKEFEFSSTESLWNLNDKLKDRPHYYGNEINEIWIDLKSLNQPPNMEI